MVQIIQRKQYKEAKAFVLKKSINVPKFDSKNPSDLHGAPPKMHGRFDFLGKKAAGQKQSDNGENAGHGSQDG